MGSTAEPSKNSSKAFTTRSGVPARPSRRGSSPAQRISVSTARKASLRDGRSDLCRVWIFGLLVTPGRLLFVDLVSLIGDRGRLCFHPAYAEGLGSCR